MNFSSQLLLRVRCCACCMLLYLFCQVVTTQTHTRSWRMQMMVGAVAMVAGAAMAAARLTMAGLGLVGLGVMGVVVARQETLGA
jgi:hypothetical protein